MILYRTQSDQACRRARLFADDDSSYLTKQQLGHLHLLEASIDHMYSRFESAMKNLNAVVAMEGSLPAELVVRFVFVISCISSRRFLTKEVF